MFRHIGVYAVKGKNTADLQAQQPLPCQNRLLVAPGRDKLMILPKATSRSNSTGKSATDIRRRR